MSTRLAKLLRRLLAPSILLSAAVVVALAQPVPTGGPRRSPDDVLGDFANDFMSKPATRPAAAPDAAPSAEETAAPPPPSTEPSSSAGAAALPDTNPSTAPSVASTAPSTAPSAVAQLPTTQTSGAPSVAAAPAHPTPPAPAPLTASASMPARGSRQMSPDYQVLLTRSIFTRDRRPAPSAGAGSFQPPRSDNALPRFGPGGRGGSSTASFALRGVVDNDGKFTALVEDPGTHRTIALSIGDPIFRGRVVGITLDAIEYESNGRRSRVRIGQGLDSGEPIPRGSGSLSTTLPSTTQPFATTNPVAEGTEGAGGVGAGGAAAPTTAPSTLVAPASNLPPLPGSPEEIEKMRRRRQEELAH